MILTTICQVSQHSFTKTFLCRWLCRSVFPRVPVPRSINLFTSSCPSRLLTVNLLYDTIYQRSTSGWSRTRKYDVKTTTKSFFNVHLRKNGNNKSGTRIQRTKEKLQETKVIVEKRIGDMKENIFTIPNGLSLARISATPFLGYLVIQEMYVPAMALCILAGITDLLDGYIARNFENQKSRFGSFLDPAADKFLIATLFLTLTVRGLIPVPLTVLIISRDICLVAAGFYIRYLSLPPPRTFLRYFDATLATASVSPTMISKLNTALQLGLVSITLTAPIFDFVNHPYLQTLWYLTAGTTVLSGLSYLCTKNTYKILTKVKK